VLPCSRPSREVWRSGLVRGLTQTSGVPVVGTEPGCSALELEPDH
jgi:hypothetical protein